DQLKAQAAASGGQDVELRALEREAKAQRDLLESYLAKYREANARDSMASAPAEARIISRAILSNTPSFPKKVPIVLIATLATLILSAAAITTGELLAGNVYRAADPAEDLVARARAAMSVNSEDEANSELVSASEETPASAPSPASAAPSGASAAPASGSTRRLASGLRRAGAARCLTVVGAAHNLGTTSTAIALARALAREGRVVLIDLALSSPNLAAISTEPGAPGLAELVRGAASFRHIITRDRASRVHLIAAGRVPADTGSILRSERLNIGINALARTYEHVVIDAGALPDVALERFARFAPHAVLVAPGLSDDAVQGARDRLIAAGFNDVTLFTDTPPRPDATASGPDTEAA
ncbi:MAG: GNVR domain-containing protein, partial [Xanthobacteraceae bacterium]